MQKYLKLIEKDNGISTKRYVSTLFSLNENKKTKKEKIKIAIKLLQETNFLSKVLFLAKKKKQIKLNFFVAYFTNFNFMGKRRSHNMII